MHEHGREMENRHRCHGLCCVMGLTFMNALLEIWLGNRSADKQLKDAMLQGIQRLAQVR